MVEGAENIVLDALFWSTLFHPDVFKCQRPNVNATNFEKESSQELGRPLAVDP